MLQLLEFVFGEGLLEKKKRGTRSQRRQPIRKPIPSPAAPRDNTLIPSASQEEAPSHLLFPGIESFVTRLADDLPEEILPLYAALAVVYQAVGGRTDIPVVLPNMQFAQALRDLGFQAELIPATMEVIHDPTGRLATRALSPKKAYWSQGHLGHAVVYTSTFSRAIDLAPCHNPALYDKSGRSKIGSMPVVLPLSFTQNKFVNEDQLVTQRDDHVLSWMVFPMSRFMFAQEHKRFERRVQEGANFISAATIDLMRTLIPVRNMESMIEIYPNLRRLLSR